MVRPFPVLIRRLACCAAKILFARIPFKPQNVTAEISINTAPPPPSIKMRGKCTHAITFFDMSLVFTEQVARFSLFWREAGAATSPSPASPWVKTEIRECRQPFACNAWIAACGITYRPGISFSRHVPVVRKRAFRAGDSCIGRENSRASPLFPHGVSRGRGRRATHRSTLPL